jgi:hypothetical protein
MVSIKITTVRARARVVRLDRRDDLRRVGVAVAGVAVVGVGVVGGAIVGVVGGVDVPGRLDPVVGAPSGADVRLVDASGVPVDAPRSVVRSRPARAPLRACGRPRPGPAPGRAVGRGPVGIRR